MIGPINWKNWITVSSDLFPDTDYRSLFHFPHHCGIGNCRRFICIFFYSHRLIFTTLGDANKIMNPQHFGSDPEDIRIRIQINSEIWIRILDHFCLRFWPWGCLLSLSTVYSLSQKKFYPLRFSEFFSPTVENF